MKNWLNDWMSVIILFLFVIPVLSQAPTDDGTIVATENYNSAVNPPIGMGSFNFINSVALSAAADINGTGQGVEFLYDANLFTAEEVTLHTFPNVAPGNYIIQYEINAANAGFTYDAVISDGTSTKTQTVGVQTGNGAFQKRYTAQLTVAATSTVSFTMQMSPFVSAFTNSLVYIDDVELIQMNATLPNPATGAMLVQTEDFNAAMTPPTGAGAASFTSNIELSVAADVAGTGQGVEFDYSGAYAEVTNSIDMVTFSNVAPGTYYIDYQYQSGNSNTNLDFTYYNRIVSSAGSEDNYVVSPVNGSFSTHRTYEVTTTTTGDISLELYLLEKGNNVTNGTPIYIDDVRLMSLPPACTNTFGTDTRQACDSLTWIDGMTYTTSNNTATFTTTNADGCDSVITLNLTILESTQATDTRQACDSLTWIDGMTYTTSNNTATFTTTNADGCDSVITLNLTILESTQATDTRQACDSLTWIDGMTYTASNNTATFTITNADGCDSIITLNLTILESTEATDTRQACDSFTWIDGMTYSASNNSATFTTTNADGCDSVITLNLTILESTEAIVDTTQCGGIYISPSGRQYTSSQVGILDTISNSVGCDSVITINLTIDDCLDEMELSLSDPCSCENPNNLSLADGTTLFADTLKIDVSMIPNPDPVTLIANDGNLLDEFGNPISTPLVITNQIDAQTYFLVFYTRPNTPATIIVDANGNSEEFTTESCAECRVVPTLGEWGIVILSLSLLIISVAALKSRNQYFLTQDV